MTVDVLEGFTSVTVIVLLIINLTLKKTRRNLDANSDIFVLELVIDEGLPETGNY